MRRLNHKTEQAARFLEESSFVGILLVANIKYVVELAEAERDQLDVMIKRGKMSATANRKARILLKADKGPYGEHWTDRKIWQSLSTSPSTVARVRETFVLSGFDAVFARKQQKSPSTRRIFDGEAEAKLVALACSQPPEGYCRWTIRLLAEKVIELNIVETAHFNTVNRTLKKMNLNLTEVGTG